MGFDLEEEILNSRNNKLNEKNTIEYKRNNDAKKAALINLGKLKSKEPISKLQTYEAIKIETEQLLTREKIIFTINSIITAGLIVITFQVI